MNLMDKYRLRLNDARQSGDEAKPEEPVLIESSYLKGTFYLAANEAQAGKIEKAGGVCYIPSEVRALLNNSTRMDEEASKDYLGKVHMVKRIFPGARIKET